LEQPWHLTNEISQIFQTSGQGFSFLMLRGKEYQIGDSMVVEQDEPYEGHSWT